MPAVLVIDGLTVGYRGEAEQRDRQASDDLQGAGIDGRGAAIAPDSQRWTSRLLASLGSPTRRPAAWNARANSSRLMRIPVWTARRAVFGAFMSATIALCHADVAMGET